MTREDINEYMQERNKVLEKRNVGLLISFMEKWSKKGVFPVRDVENLKRSSETTQLVTLCKMISNVPTLSRETQIWARRQLMNLGTKTTLIY